MNIPQRLCLLSCLCASAGFAAVGAADPPLRFIHGVNPDASAAEIFDAFHIKMGRSDLSPQKHRSFTPLPAGSAVFPTEFRTIDGTGNNETNPSLGAANTPLLRTTTVGYGDGLGTPGGANEQSPRLISNEVVAQTDLIPNTTNTTDFLWQWGQFLDHDMSLTPTGVPAEEFDIPVPQGDPQFDPQGLGTKVLPFKRSLFVTDLNGVRQQVNVNTAFIDGSQVYGSDTARAQELRTLDGTGHLKTSDNNLLPFNLDGFANQPNSSPTFFIAGDIRANEQAGLTALQTLFMREHNFWADSFHAGDPTLTDDDLYFRARAMVGAEIQVITYRDFLPVLLGRRAMPAYTGYNPAVDPSIANVFSTSAFRFGHSMLPLQIRRLDASDQTIVEGDLLMHDAFFNPANITGTDLGIEPYLRGLARQLPQQIDIYMVDALRAFLNGPPGGGGFDLAALNIQRLRDHGMPGYNQVRTDYGLATRATFADLTTDTTLQAKLASAYATTDDIDIWVGALVEDHRPASMVGQTILNILKDQFVRLRDGDRFWYESYFPADTVTMLNKLRLSTIIKRNTTIRSELQLNVFLLPKS